MAEFFPPFLIWRRLLTGIFQLLHDRSAIHGGKSSAKSSSSASGGWKRGQKRRPEIQATNTMSEAQAQSLAQNASVNPTPDGSADLYVSGDNNPLPSRHEFD